jgi:hypothetical protein
VRGELYGRNVEGCVWAAVLTGDGGDGGAAINLPRGKRSRCSERSPVVGRRRGELMVVSEWCEGGSGAQMAEKWAATVAVPFKGGWLKHNGGGGGGQATCGRRNGGERGGPGAMKNGSGGWHRPPAGGRGQWCCRTTVAGGRTRVTRARSADRQDRATVRPGWQRRGMG